MMKSLTFTIGLFFTSASVGFACSRADVEFILTQQNVVTEQVEYFREEADFLTKDIQSTIESLEGTILDQEAFDAFFTGQIVEFVDTRGMELFSEALCTGLPSEDVQNLAAFYRSDKGQIWLEHANNPALLKRFYVWMLSGAWQHSEYAYRGTRAYVDAYSQLLDEQFDMSERVFDPRQFAAVIRRKDIVGYADDNFREERARGFEALSDN